MELPKSIVLRGREFTEDELKLIAHLVSEYWEHGRTKISEEICKRIDWRQPNGWLKDRACRDVLRSLEKRELVKLPPSRSSACSPPYTKWNPPAKADFGSSQVTSISDEIQIRLAKGNKNENLWNHLVSSHHYLGHKVSVGRALKFLITSGERPLAAVSLSEAAWAVEDRDKVLSSLGILRESVANNSRFLILPGIQVKNLASQVLALVAKYGCALWYKYYGQKVHCLETFVDVSRYKGTSYRAANWISVGFTKGYRKSGSCHHNSQVPKEIFLYPLDKLHRDKLMEMMRDKA